ncbi:MAG: metallophosphoesterase [Smithella sp.]|jgi:predicted phosphodiesterase
MAERIVFGTDTHFGAHNEKAVKVFLEAARAFQPNRIVLGGDILNGGAFSSHPPTPGEKVMSYDDELDLASEFVTAVQGIAGRVAYIEGNHEYRIPRWIEAHNASNMYSVRQFPRYALGNGRKNFCYIDYGSKDGNYPHYRLNKRVVCVHGWCHARNATRIHLDKAQGMSMLHGHTHRAESIVGQYIWSAGYQQAHSCGCLCKRIPIYGTGSPVEWVNGFIVGYLGRHSDTFYFVPIRNGECTLPDGTKIG